MPSGFNPDHGLPSLRADAPDAAAHLRALYATGYIGDVEADDLLHSIEHGRLSWEKALDETLIDQFIDDIHNLHIRRWPEAPGRRDAERAICPEPGARVPDATARASSSVCQEGQWILLGCRCCASWPPAGPAAVAHPDVLRDAVLPGDVDAALVQGEGKARASSRIWIVRSSPGRLPVAQAQRGNPADADLGVLRLTGVG
jgi:hypothetical protein